MEIYTLDALFRRQTVTDVYVSLIWTERFNTIGDMELVLPSTQANRALFKPGVLLACNKSYRVMVVTTVEEKQDASTGERLYTVTGTSLESIFSDRVAYGVLDDLVTAPNWTLTGTPGAIVRQIVHDICVTGIISEYDKIPFIVEDTFMPESTIEESVDEITVELEPKTVYDAIADICNTYSLGFRLLRQTDDSKLYFDVYSGCDRTTQQTALTPVIFSAELDTLYGTTKLTTNSGYKNVAYVYSNLGAVEVLQPNLDPETEGFERHVMPLKVDDYDTEVTEEDAIADMTAQGLLALAEVQQYTAFDGEISQNNPYTYGSDYYLGDIVEVRDADGTTTNMRITEQIFSSDNEGEKEYPTMTAKLYIDSNTWLSWLSQQVWENLGTTLYWNNVEDQ